jgi:hypothetical protein
LKRPKNLGHKTTKKMGISWDITIQQYAHGDVPVKKDDQQWDFGVYQYILVVGFHH